MSELKYSRIIQVPAAGCEDFFAFQARQHAFDGLMNPVLGFDHFRMKKDVFGAHKHRHMSAISYLFEDSIPYHNEDSIGTNLTITPGSLLWTWAGSGVIHHEVPTVDGEVHGLQLFLDISPENRALPPKSIYIPIETMPVVKEEGSSIKVAMGAAADAVNKTSTPEPVTLLEILLDAGKTTGYLLPAEWNATVYLLSGSVTINDRVDLSQNQAIAFGSAGADEQITIATDAGSRLLLISGPPVGIINR